MADILRLAGSSRVPVRQVSRAQLDAMAQTDSPQGVLATAEPLREGHLDGLAATTGSRPPLLVVLDGVTDPHNLGAVMRSAVCAGATGLVIGRHRSARLSPAAIKAAAGAAEHLPVAIVAGIPAALAQLGAAGVWTVGLEPGSSSSLWDLTLAAEPIALVLGAEGRGLSRLVLRRCDVLVEIPLTGPIDSLNVSAAAALACFEVARRRSAQRTTASAHH
jgi:23S rRNA (guanosine2251-2'-O)-methyltransferase